MSHVSKFTRDALNDIEAASRWYESQRPGLGISFANAVEAVVRDIADAPMMFRLVNRELRKARVPRFPYAAYFGVEGNSVIVVAVVHDRRDPSVWQNRR